MLCTVFPTEMLTDAKVINMPTSNSSSSPEDILQNLLEQAEKKWGVDRAREIKVTLENASEQLSEVSNNLPDKETEPGFYQ